MIEGNLAVICVQVDDILTGGLAEDLTVSLLISHGTAGIPMVTCLSQNEQNSLLIRYELST